MMTRRVRLFTALILRRVDDEFSVFGRVHTVSARGQTIKNMKEKSTRNKDQSLV